MRNALALLALTLATATLSGCLSQISATEDSGSLRIHWRDAYESARGEAVESGRPMLLVLVAGALRDRC
jgi:hypothetical protein